MKTELWVKNGYVFTGSGFRHTCIKIIDGVIEALYDSNHEPLKGNDVNIIDAGGYLVVPGFIDAHVHFNDPGRTDWEGIETGSLSAAIGGTTTIFDMPLNCSPSVTNVKNLHNKSEYLTSKSYIDYALWGGMTGNNVQNKAELAQMSKGIIGWKAFMSDSGIDDFPYVAPEQLKQAMKIAADQNKILALHAESQEDIHNLTTFYKNQYNMNERKAFLASRPISAEEQAVISALELASKYGTAIHFVHISSPKVVKTIQQAKKSGINVTVETCPHYLIFDEEDFLKKGPILKCAPPLRPREKVEGLWECITNGWIDTIGSDHSPCLYSMKNTDSIWEAWGGIQGVQFTWLALLDEALKRRIPLKDILPMGTANVADRFGISEKKGRIRPGLDADLALISLDETTFADQSSIAFRNKYSPYENRTFLMKIKKTILRGKVIYDDQAGGTEEKYGQYLQPRK
ncbi:allantoinase AllB [Bacillus sp. EB106-08-02-XG196]|jgi:allantoinase|uniref:allantoinase AllB n=1 Tax=Bacillus sp. EB106-08-02-XG196 TaxID=2737049 RepID=UPI0015C4BE50|nr:allantoinase AllB [Bacillus sp. EB106-08-02-XG196]NWQ40703.1 allantoinase AllB [Bacillus sp. EB106-08-02-XG196]